MTTVFLAGSRNLSRLTDAVKERLDNIVSQQFRVVVGDANGADKALQQHLAGARYRNVVVHCSGSSCRNNLGNWDVASVAVPPGLRGRDFYTVKDRKMADEADYGFMIWDAESPGTLNNIIELVNRHKKVLVYIFPEQLFSTIASESEVKNLLRRCDKETAKVLAARILHSNSDESAGSVSQAALSILGNAPGRRVSRNLSRNVYRNSTVQPASLEEVYRDSTGKDSRRPIRTASAASCNAVADRWTSSREAPAYSFDL